MSDHADAARGQQQVWEFHQPYFDAADDPMWIEDRRDRTLLALNDTAGRFFGVERPSVLGRSVETIADVPLPRPETGTSARWALRIDDSPRVLDVRLHPLDFALRPSVLVVGRDLTALLAPVDADVWARSVGASATEVLSELLLVRRGLRAGGEVDAGLDRAIERAADLVLSLGAGPRDPAA